MIKASVLIITLLSFKILMCLFQYETIERKIFHIFDITELM